MLFTFGFLLGYVSWRMFAGKRTGEKLERSIRFLIKNHYIHIHHWIWCSIAIIILVAINFSNVFVYGILAGSIVQGLLYKDRFVIFYKKKDFEKIYARYR